MKSGRGVMWWKVIDERCAGSYAKREWRMTLPELAHDDAATAWLVRVSARMIAILGVECGETEERKSKPTMRSGTLENLFVVLLLGRRDIHRKQSMARQPSITLEMRYATNEKMIINFGNLMIDGGWDQEAMFLLSPESKVVAWENRNFRSPPIPSPLLHLFVNQFGLSNPHPQQTHISRSRQSFSEMNSPCQSQSTASHQSLQRSVRTRPH